MALSLNGKIGRLIFCLLFISIVLGQSIFLSKYNLHLELMFGFISLLVGGPWFFERSSLLSETIWLERTLIQPEMDEKQTSSPAIFQAYVAMKYEIERGISYRISSAFSKIEPLIWICVLITVLLLLGPYQALP
jgi:hypothetical protein